jgi:hypothetical protein
MSRQGKAMVRELIEDIEGVSQTWFELEIEGSSRKKTLVVEVSVDLDPNGAHHLRHACDEIERTFSAALREVSGDQVSKLKIVNRSRSADATSGQKSGKNESRSAPN